MTTVHLICKPCSDPYYAGSPMNLAFPTKELADRYIEAMEGAPDAEDATWQEYRLYSVEVSILLDIPHDEHVWDWKRHLQRIEEVHQLIGARS